MGIDFNRIKSKAQEALGKHGDKVEQGLDKASGAAKSRFGNKSEQIDGYTQKAKDFVRKQDEQGSGDGNEGGQQQPPQPPRE